MFQTVLNSHQARWLLQLAPYDFTIHYYKSTLNPADGLSCQPDYLTDCVEDTNLVGRLILLLVNKLATTMLGAGVQSSVRGRESVKGSDSVAESLI